MIRKATREHLPFIEKALEKQEQRYQSYKKDDELAEKWKDSAVALPMSFGLNTAKERKKRNQIREILNEIRDKGEALLENEEQAMLGLFQDWIYKD